MTSTEPHVGIQNTPTSANVPAMLSSQPGKIFLTVKEAALRLGVKPGWIYERTARKAIPHRKLGKFVRFTEQDLQTIIDAAATGTLQ
jgi:excisionase family DNA binding protein